jgi:uncharacterized membrane protein
VYLNLLFLLLITLLSLSTSLVINYGTYKIPHIIYCSLVIVTSLLLTLIWWYATKNKYLDKNLHLFFIKGVMANLMAIPIVFTISIFISFVNLDIAQYFWLVIVPLTIAIRRRYKH